MATNPTQVADLDLKSVLDLWKKDVLLSLNSHHVAVVESFDPDAQTVTAKVAYKRIVSGVAVEYPLLLDLPVVVLGGGSAHLEMPIAKGDECLVLFNDRDIDSWFNSGTIGPVNSQRLHSFADGFALVGVRSLLRSLEDYDTTRASLRNGETRVGVSSSKVKVENANRTLNALLNNMADLTSNLQTALTTFATGLTPVTLVAKGAALATAIGLLDTAISTLKTTQIDDLLD